LLSLVCSGATIADGTGRALFSTDLGMVADRIVIIGDCSDREAAVRLDCSGLVVAPGFIDTHTHDEDRWLTHPRCEGKIVQGVTTEIGGACGRGPRERFPAFLGQVARERPALNVAALSWSRSPAAAREACEAGALGLSLDLGESAQPGELDALIQAAREGGAGRVGVHLRNESREVVEALDEATELALRHEVALQVYHAKAEWDAPGRVERLLEGIDRARERGLDAHLDVYPYIASWPALAALLPGLAAPQNDPERAAAALRAQLRYGDRWEKIVLSETGTERSAAWCGETIGAIAQAQRRSPARMLVDLIEQEGAAARAICFSMNEDDVATLIGAPFALIASAAPALPLREPIPLGRAHPRAFGTFPRLFGRFVRRRATLSFLEAIRRITSLPARVYGLRDRALIATGAYADLVAFAEREIADTATYDHPASAPAGVMHVVVNGVPALRDGRLTGARSGRVLLNGRS
jgi:N-acyl-D-amino-acid deacylase